MSVRDRVAVITGAAGNLGTAVTTRFLAQGARVVASCLSPAEHDALCSAFPDQPNLLAIAADVTVESDVERLMAEAHSQLGGPHLLLNLVGGYAAGTALADTDLATWDHMLSLNLKSVFLCCKHALRYMGPQDYGRIVAVSSKVAVDLPARSAAYAVAKAGVVTLVKCLADELKGTNVSVTAIMPSIIDTPVTRSARPKADCSKWVTPEQIAEVLLLLAGEEARTVNGAVLPLFGGL